MAMPAEVELQMRSEVASREAFEREFYVTCIQMTKDGVTHLAWHPDASRLLLAAGDKSGRLALWQVGAPCSCSVLWLVGVVEDGGPVNQLGCNRH
jgi:hypothetical protein